MEINRPLHKKAIITIVTSNCFHQAHILGKSIKLFEKEADFIVFVIDFRPNDTCYQECEFQVVDARILNPNEWDRFVFQYKGISACCALKPRALFHILLFYEKVIYLDSDIKLFHELTEAWSELDHCDLSLIPQRNGAPSIVTPIIPQMMLRISGIFNAGYIGTSRCANHFLDWWWEKTHYNCLVDDYIIGIYLDQLYLHEAIGRVERLGILRNNGYNVAWWNFDQRNIKRFNDRYFINDRPLVFFHYSCFSFFLKNIKNFGWLKSRFGKLYFELYSKYISELSYYKNKLQLQSYAYDHFSDGASISYDWREYMRRDIPELKEINHPFALSKIEREEIETIMSKRPEFFQPNPTREINNWRNSDLVFTRALNKSDSYIRFLEKIIHEHGCFNPDISY
ncbi:MAG: hypothetical protein K9M81_04215 [Chthoniobacterales bacterium]|nr:hypothetical protein [Chthoniobacterales bacterium]